MRTERGEGKGGRAAWAALFAMYRSGGGRSSLSSSSGRPKASGSGSRPARPGASARGRSPRRSRSPSPRGRRHRSPSPRRTGRARSPSGASRSRRGSEQRDGSLSRRLSPKRHSFSFRRCPHFQDSCSPSRHSESSVEQNLWTEFSSDYYGIETQERRRLSGRRGSPVDTRERRRLSDRRGSPVDTQERRRLSDRQGSPVDTRERRRLSDTLGSPVDTRERRRLSDRLGLPVDTREQRRLSDRLGSPVDSLSDADRDYLDDDSAFIRPFSCSQSLERYRSRDKRSPSPFTTRYDEDYRGRDAFCQSDYNMNDDHLLDLSREPDRDGKLFTKLLDLSEEEGLRRRRRNTSRDNPSSDYTSSGLTNSLQSSEYRYLCRPKEVLMMPKKSILKKRVDDPSMQPSKQNSGSCLRQKEYKELTPESADLHGDFLLRHERASQDRSEFSHILCRTAKPSSVQPKRQRSSLDVEEEGKFLYDDDEEEEDDSNISYPSTEKLMMNGGKEFLSLNERLPSPVQPMKPDTSGGSRIEYEKIHDLLRTIGLDIGVAEIDKGAARTQERLHGKKTMCPLGSHSVVSHKPHSNEKDSIQGSTHSPKSNEKNSLSSCDSFQTFNDVLSVSISEHSESKTLLHNNSAGSPEQYFPLVSVTPSAPPSLPDLPVLPLPTPHYLVSYFSAFTTSQLLQHYPLPTMPPPRYNAYGQYMAYSASAWPIYAPPQESNPAFPDVQGLGSVTTPPKCTRSNLRVIKTVSLNKVNPEIKRNRSALVEIPITPSDSKLVSQSFVGAAAEKISDKKTPAFEKPNGFRVGDRMPADEECNKGNGITVQPENNSNKISLGAFLLRNPHCEQSQEYLNKNPLCEERRNLDHQAGLSLIPETECSLKPTQCGKQKEGRDERSAEVARKEESEITKELREEGNKKDIYKEKDYLEVKKEAEKEESQMESSQSSSEKCSLRKPETDNHSQDQEVAAPKDTNVGEGKFRESKSQSRNPDSTQKITMTKAQNLGMTTKRQKTERIQDVQQQFKSFDSPHCHSLFPLPPVPPLSLFQYPGSGLSYNVCIPPFSESLLFHPP